ncbi:hypothetical protein BDP27DRAFT_1435259 [Rhodocollybia butyracea]|uniref:Uncharacterized protein n=1 Tax=Rhodocollybia butyracea TaxID=206335 RepID=A0A9P5TVY6_9AGAR|nr:hypothetical protein BDP27DRAFT_1435259 [Rhodocollybia butyracea]
MKPILWMRPKLTQSSGSSGDSIDSGVNNLGIIPLSSSHSSLSTSTPNSTTHPSGLPIPAPVMDPHISNTSVSETHPPIPTPVPPPAPRRSSRVKKLSEKALESLWSEELERLGRDRGEAWADDDLRNDNPLAMVSNSVTSSDLWVPCLYREATKQLVARLNEEGDEEL